MSCSRSRTKGFVGFLLQDIEWLEPTAKTHILVRADVIGDAGGIGVPQIRITGRRTKKSEELVFHKPNL